MRLFILWGSVLLLGCGQSAAQDTAPRAAEPKLSENQSGWLMDPARSSISFSGTHDGEKFSGRFTKFSAAIVLDPSNLDPANINAEIDIASFESGGGDRDDTFNAKDWFYLKKFPKAKFTAAKIRTSGDDYVAEGTLTIKGVSKTVSLPFSLDIKGDAAVAEGSVILNRLDYSLGTGGYYESADLVGHDVVVDITITATR